MKMLIFLAIMITVHTMDAQAEDLFVKPNSIVCNEVAQLEELIRRDTMVQGCEVVKKSRPVVDNFIAPSENPSIKFIGIEGKHGGYRAVVVLDSALLFDRDNQCFYCAN